jgi:methionine-rich copper-binding protein CopC
LLWRVTAPGGRSAARALTLATGLLLLLLPIAAAAHAIVLDSVPAPNAVLPRPPAQVVLRFNSKIEKQLTRVTLTGGGGPPRPVSVAKDVGGDAGQPDRIVVPLGPLPPGPYVIRYKVLSADGHVTEGTLRFTVSASP